MGMPRRSKTIFSSYFDRHTTDPSRHFQFSSPYYHYYYNYYYYSQHPRLPKVGVSIVSSTVFHSAPRRSLEGYTISKPASHVEFLL